MTRETPSTKSVWYEDDMYVACHPTLGTVSQGHTKQQALDNLEEATQLYLEALCTD